MALLSLHEEDVYCTAVSSVPLITKYLYLMSLLLVACEFEDQNTIFKYFVLNFNKKCCAIWLVNKFDINAPLLSIK